MSTVHEIKFFKKNSELFVALYDKPSLFFPEFWIANIKVEELGFETLPNNIKLEYKYKVEKLGIEPFEFHKEGFAFGISEFINRVTKEKSTSTIHNNQVVNMYNQGNYYEQKGDNNTMSNIAQTHSGGGDNVAGDKNVTHNYNFQDSFQAAEKKSYMSSKSQVTLRDLRNAGLIDTLATCFDQEYKAKNLLLGIYFPPKHRPVFNKFHNPYAFWQEICELIESGVLNYKSSHEGFKQLVEEAKNEYPGSSKLKEIYESFFINGT